MRSEAPDSLEDAAELLAACAAGGEIIRISGGRTKLGWGSPVPDSSVDVSTAGLARIVEHNTGDLTVIVDAGVRLEALKETLAEKRQMLAVDPPNESGDATVGGMVATADSGPLRHRYGAIRDLIVGATLVLADGTIAKSGGTVIKNVAGYDLAKLFCGSFGTLGLVGRVALRLHPRPQATATARAMSDDTHVLQRAALAVSHLPLEADCLDVWWISGTGEVLARFSGAACTERAAAACDALKEVGADTAVDEDDDALWTRQRHAQRVREGAVVRVSGAATALANVLNEAQKLEGRVAGRAALGTSFVALGGEDSDLVGAIEELRRALVPNACTVLDAPEAVRAKVDVWGEVEPGSLRLMRRVKERFDPQGILNRGIFVGGI
ncbi:MAG: FAD-binding oxidoreductase [Actinomycetota bacterium]